MSILYYNNNVMVRVATDEFLPNIMARVATDGILPSMNTYMFWSESPPTDYNSITFFLGSREPAAVKSVSGQLSVRRKKRAMLHYCRRRVATEARDSRERSRTHTGTGLRGGPPTPGGR